MAERELFQAIRDGIAQPNVNYEWPLEQARLEHIGQLKVGTKTVASMLLV